MEEKQIKGEQEKKEQLAETTEEAKTEEIMEEEKEEKKLTEETEEAEIEEVIEEEKEEKAEGIPAETGEEMPPPSKEEEEAKPPPREEKPEEEIIEERIYTIPLGKAWVGPPRKRAPRAVRIIKSFLIKHMKLEKREEGEEEAPKRLIISNEVNEKIWSKGIEKPPRKVRVRAAKDKEGNVTVYLAEGD